MSDGFASSITDLSGELGIDEKTLRRWKSKGAPIQKTRRGYNVGRVRRWREREEAKKIAEEERRKAEQAVARAREAESTNGNATDPEIDRLKARLLEEQIRDKRLKNDERELEQKRTREQWIPLEDVMERERRKAQAYVMLLDQLRARAAPDMVGVRTVAEADAVLRKHIDDLRRKVARAGQT